MTDHLRPFLEEIAKAGNPTITAMAQREACRQQGHRYQVHGKQTPTKLVCLRCGVSWAIGARTEPRP